MKTLTEFSGTMIRMAARAEGEARKSLPPEVLAIAPAKVPEGGLTAKPDETADAPALTGSGADSPTDAADQALAEQSASGAPAVAGEAESLEAKPGEAGTTEDEMQPGAAEEEAREEAVEGQDLAGSGPTAETTRGGAQAAEVNADEQGALKSEAETSAVKEALDKAVSEATGTTAERLDRLREALRAVGKQADRVRLVRVFAGEEPVAGAKKIGEHQYIVDLMPHSMKQNFEQNDRDKRRGPKRPSGGKQKGAEGSLEGSFSMETVAQDRRSERSTGGGGPGGRGRPGGGRGGPGGGRGAGGPGGRSGPGGGRGAAGGRPGGGGGRPGGDRGPKPGGAPKS